MASISYSAAQHPGQLRTLVETPQFIVNETISGGLLANAFGYDEWHRLNTNYAQIFAASNKYKGKPLVGMLDAKGKVIDIPSQSFRFTLSGGNNQKARITRVICTDPKPGINNTEFELVFDRPWFSVSSVIQPQHNEYRLLVKRNSSYTTGKSYRVLGANQYAYTVQVIGNSATNYLPAHFIQTEMEFNETSTLVANESNKEGAGFSFYSVFENEGHIQQFSRKASFTDKVCRQMLRVAEGQMDRSSCDPIVQDHMKFVWTAMTSEDGLQKKLFGMQLVEAKLWESLYSDVEDAYMFGKASSNMYSEEGFQMYSASGLREQLESSWKLEHTGSMSIAELEQWFDIVLRDRIENDSQKIVLSSGLSFKRMFDTMIKADSSSFLTLDSVYIRKGEDYRHLDYGSHFSSYKGFTVDIDVMHNKSYDNKFFCPQSHPQFPDIPVDSWRADILDFGTSTQKMGDIDNITALAETYANYYITYNGKHYNPWQVGVGKSGLPIADGGLGTVGSHISGYSIHMEKSGGLLVVDPTRCGVIKLAATSQDNY